MTTTAPESDSERLSDAALLRDAITHVSTPAGEMRSFALHAPLELLARHALLAHVEPSARELVRLQLLAAAEHYRRTTKPLECRRVGPVPAAADGIAALREAIGDGDMPAAAEITSELVRELSAPRLVRGLVPATLDSLAAAGHAPILFQRLATLDAALAADARPLLVALVPELARTPQLRFSWRPKPEASTAEAAPELVDQVARSLGAVVAEASEPAPIFAVVHAAESSGAADRVLAPALRLDWSQEEVAESLTRLACRLAVRSMLAEPVTHAKYGWTHALTLAHANRALLRLGGDPKRCTRNALLYALGFRHALAERALPEQPDLPRVGGAPAEALAADPTTAAAQAYHCGPEAADALWSRLATEAAIRNDAHLVKHTVSALEMSREDPEAAPIYRAAAAKLAALWIAEHPAEAIRDLLDRRE